MYEVIFLLVLLLIFVLILVLYPRNSSTIKTFNVGVTPTGMAVTPDSKYLYVANNNNYSIPGSDSVTVINLRNGLPITTITDASFNQPYTITMDSSGLVAYVTNSASPALLGQQGTITIIDTSTKKVLGVLSGFDGPSGMAIKNNVAYVNNYGAAAGLGSGNGKTISVVDLSTKAITAIITTNQAPAALALTPDQKYLYVANYVDGNPGTGTVQVIDTSTNKITTTITGFSGPFAITMNPKSNYAYVTNFGSNNFEPYGTTVSVISLVSNTIIATITLGIQPSGIAVTPNGKRAYVSNYNSLYTSPSFDTLVPGQGTVNIIDLDNNTVLYPTIPVGQSPANVVIPNNGSYAYVSNFTSNTVNGIKI